MKRILAGALTVLLMGLLLWAGAGRPTASPSEPGAPPPTTEAPNPASGAEARLQTLLENSAQGDVSGYLACFGGPLRDRLERELTERGRDTFAADLRQAARARKSHATFAPEPDGPDSARITVETVYPDRNERQTFRLEQGPTGWLVTGVETVRSHQPKAKYGSQASYQEPEGPPVPSTGLTVETGDDN